MGHAKSFDELVREGESASVDGWDFSWLDGRATEERPSWGYLKLMSSYMARAQVALDVQTGGGEVLAEAPRLAPVTMATEGWPPNVALARRHLEPLGVTVVEVGENDPFPFADATFDLVVSRHPNVVLWPEIARVLAPGGVYLAQQIGPGSNRILSEFFLGPITVDQARSAATTRAAAEAAGMVIDELREEELAVVFHDIGAVVYFLRKVIWALPDFTVDRYRDRLAAMHRQIERDGHFTSYTRRILVRAHKP